MSDKTWKARERQAARYFGCPDRNPLSGRNSKHTASDTLHHCLFIEHKHRKRHAIVRLWYRVKALALKENKIAVVTLSEHGKPGLWVMCHSSDLNAVATQRWLAKRKEEGIE